MLVPFGMKHCIFKASQYCDSLNLGSKARNLSTRYTKIKSDLRNLVLGVNKKTRDNFRAVTGFLGNAGSKVLVIGGGAIGSGSKFFYEFCEQNNVVIESMDVYASPFCTVIADAHYLPFAPETFDAVIIQAVLEHVVDPGRVVSEINRVLCEGGIVYSETPFIQCVHEGPYDFMRFTNSGHRILFRDFEEIDAGALQGAFTSSLFICSYAMSGIFRSRYVGVILRILLSRVASLFDALIPKRWNIDVACGNYFIGRSNSDNDFNDTDNTSWIVNYYAGAQRK